MIDSTFHLAGAAGRRIAYTDTGAGPVVLLSPGMGDLRESYRALIPALVSAGYRAIAIDLRGHGDSDVRFDSYGDAETADDLITVLDAIGAERATVVGNSMSAGAAVITAAEHPDRIDAIVLSGPFVRPPTTPVALRVLFRLMTARPWAAAVWNAYLPSLFAGTKPADFAAYRGRVVAALRRPGRARAFSLTTHVDHAVAEARLDEVRAPSLVVMGELDPDFPKPADEAAWIGDRLGSEVLLVPDAGHYPHAQRPDLVTPAVLAFLGRVHEHA